MKKEKHLTMKDYVIETPKVVLKNIEKSESLTRKLVKEYCAKEYKKMIFVASGSSYHGVLCAEEFMHKMLKVEIEVVTPFTYLHYHDAPRKDEFIVVVSQGGYSTNSIEALQYLKKKGHTTIGLTGDVHSDFKKYCDVLVDWGVGIEKVLMVTKGVTTLALFLDLFALEVAKKKEMISSTAYNNWIKEIKKTVSAHKELQQSSFRYIQKHPQELLSMKNVWLISAGSNLATAKEGSLKIGESIKIHASAYEAEEFLHGPVYPITPEYTIIVMDSNDVAGKRIREIYKTLKQITPRVILITNQSLKGDDIISTKVSLKEELQPLAYLAVCPLLSEYASESLQTIKGHPLRAKLNVLQTKSNQKKKTK